MPQTSISIRMDEDLKKQFDMFCSDIGMNMTTAINVFAKTAVRERRIPFEIALDVPNAETRVALEEVASMKKNRQVGKSYSDVDEMMKDLLK